MRKYAHICVSMRNVAHICAHTLRIYARIVCAYMRAYLIFFGGYGRILGGRIPPVCAHIRYAWKPYYLYRVPVKDLVDRKHIYVLSLFYEDSIENKVYGC